jgi:hypothetical protein
MPRKIKVVDIEQVKVEKEINTEIPNEPEPSEIKEPETVIEDVQPIVVEDTPVEEAIKTEQNEQLTNESIINKSTSNKIKAVNIKNI